MTETWQHPLCVACCLCA